MRERRLCVAVSIATAVVVSGCASAKFIPTGTILPAKPENCDMEVFTSRVPDRPYREIGIIEGEGSWGAESLEEVLPEMIKKACLAGGDALILISNERTMRVSGAEDFLGSDEELHTVGTVIVWTDGE